MSEWLREICKYPDGLLPFYIIGVFLLCVALVATINGVRKLRKKLTEPSQTIKPSETK